MLKIRHGFDGQRLVFFPFYIEEEALNNPLSADLVLHSMGYFPKAKGHFINRPLGCNEYILIYCTKGEGWFVVNNNKYQVKENQFFILPADKPHSYGADDNSPWSIYWAHFKGSKAPFIYSQIQTINMIPVSEKRQTMHRLLIFCT